MTLSEYEALIAGAQTYSADRYGPKVLGWDGERCVKLFRRKRLLSTALVVPYAKRFAKAADRLARQGVRCVKVRQVARVPALQRHIVEYDYLPGTPLRQELVAAQDDPARLASLLQHQARFLAKLHAERIYFRAVHFNNVIVCPDDELGLIDISEVWSSPIPLNAVQRARNFRPMVKYAEDRAALRAYGFDRFVADYLDAAELSAPSRAIFRAWIAAMIRPKA